MAAFMVLLTRGLLLALLASLAGAAFTSDQAVLESHAQAWLASHHGSPSAEALLSLKEEDPNSYALVQGLLSSDAVVLSLAGSEARSMDKPQLRFQPKHRDSQRAKFAGIQAMPRQGKSLVSSSTFQRTVETAAGLAEDASKLNWDFGEAAAPPALKVKVKVATAMLATPETPKSPPKPHNALLADAEAVAHSDELPPASGSGAFAQFVPMHKKPAADPDQNEYTSFLKF